MFKNTACDTMLKMRCDELHAQKIIVEMLVV